MVPLPWGGGVSGMAGWAFLRLPEWAECEGQSIAMVSADAFDRVEVRAVEVFGLVGG